MIFPCLAVSHHTHTRTLIPDMTYTSSPLFLSFRLDPNVFPYPLLPCSLRVLSSVIILFYSCPIGVRITDRINPSFFG